MKHLDTEDTVRYSRLENLLFASIALLLPLHAQQGAPSSQTFLKHIFPSRDYITAGNPGVAGGSSAEGTAGNGIFYHGGPLMTGTPNVYYIWYGNWAADPTGVTILQHFAQFDGGSPYYGINTTYYDGSATPIGNAINFGPRTPTIIPEARFCSTRIFSPS